MRKRRRLLTYENEEHNLEIVTSNVEQDFVSVCNFSLKSLFMLTVEYIIKNVNNVKSFYGVPEQIGEILYKHFQMGILKDQLALEEHDNKILHGLSVFSEAYIELLMSLNLSRSLFIVKNYNLYLQSLFTNLISLDLSFCCLEDNSSILTAITNMKRLKCLSLRGNGLKDETIRRLTLSCRMLNRGPMDICELDLSCNNDLSNKVLHYISCFKSLSLLILSDTDVTKSAVQTFGVKTGLQLQKSAFPFTEITNCGWAVDFILHLQKRNVCEENCKSKAFKFYGKHNLKNVKKGHVCKSSEVLIMCKPVLHANSSVSENIKSTLFKNTNYGDEEWTQVLKPVLESYTKNCVKKAKNVKLVSLSEALNDLN